MPTKRATICAVWRVMRNPVIDNKAYAIRPYGQKIKLIKMKYDPLKHHRRSIRLKGYDYSQAGAYFITICTHNRRHLFGEVQNGEMILTPVGEMAYNEWLKTADLRPYVSLDVFVVMPNHIHGIILIKDLQTADSGASHLHNSDNPDSQTEINTPTSGMPNVDLNVPSPALKSPSHNIGAIVRGYKSAVTRQVNSSNNVETVWQRNFYENIIRDGRAYELISNYIINNPQKWQADKFYIK
jgi:putative transposase